jgi:FkbM family methyltransferase
MDILERLVDITSTSESPFVIEFGACDGYHTNLMLDIITKNKIDYKYHIFEPIESLIPHIKNRIFRYINSNPLNVRIFNEAISSQTGQFSLYQSGGGKTENGVVVENYYGSSSIRKPKLVTEAWSEMTFTEITCNAITFDDYLKREGLENQIIDFIWADIQGAEVDLIKGGVEAFKNVRYFYTEYCESELYEGEINLQGILDLLPDFEIVEDYNGDVLLKNKFLH